jgi:CRP-like cAMP-binding protein
VDGSDHILSELGPGDFFGEVALTCDTTRTATITCKEATVVLSLNKKNYAAFRSLAPELQPIIQRFVDARTVNTLKVYFYTCTEAEGARVCFQALSYTQPIKTDFWQ